jgi:Rrf2 family protein
MPFSKSSQYAVLAMTYLAGQGFDRLLSIQEISEMVQVPTPFLRKIITLLSRAKLVQARRGPNGGVMLNRPSDEITVRAIVEAVDGPYNSRQCVLGLPECNNDNPCPLHEPWQQLKTQLFRQLHDLTLASLVQTRRRYS